MPKIEAMIKRHPRIALGKVDVKERQEIRGQYSVFSVPLILMTIEGKETLREARNISVGVLEEKLSRYENLLFDT